MLTKALELRRILSEDPLEEVGADNTLIHVPHHIDRLCVGHHQSALCAKRVLNLHILNVFKFLFQEKSRQLIRIRQALETRVHIARIAQVLQSNHAFPCRLIRNKVLLDFIKLIVEQRTTFRLVPTLIIFLALFLAVADPFAFADD